MTRKDDPPRAPPGEIQSGQAQAASARGLIDDCFRPGQPRLRHSEAIALLKSRMTPVVPIVEVGLAAASGRILAEEVRAEAPVPAHTNAAVDGYAFQATPDSRAKGIALPVTGRAAAGHPLGAAVAPGAAVRIFTGAVMPDGVDTVAMQEDVQASDVRGEQSIAIPAGLKPGANVRKAGEDVAAGSVLFARGDTLRPQDLAALASIGRARVACYGRVRVGIVSTGDEVRPVGSMGALAPGEVYDANAPMLAALASSLGASVTRLGIWPDRADEVRANLTQAAREFDVLLTSGGASLGEEDHMSRALSELGQRHLWQLAIKPGRPMMFGQIGSGGRDCVVVGLPGNPVAVFVCFLMYVDPLLRAAGGAPWREPRRFLVPAAFEFSGRKTGRREFWRGRLVETPAGLAAEKFPRDGSGLISGLRWSGGLIDISEDSGDIASGAPVAFIPYSEFGIV
jgi:molybdopterin molybdotransferase